jgi:hypothetical protein
MNRADRRLQERGKQSDIKITPRRRLAGYLVVHHERIEQQADDGMVYARNIFRVVSQDGKTLVEETPDGPKPVLLMSVAQPVRRAVIATPGKIARA